MEQIRNFDQLLQAALAHGRKGIAVAAPYDKNTLLAVKDALASGLAAPPAFRRRGAHAAPAGAGAVGRRSGEADGRPGYGPGHRRRH